ncbi:hypothetical protein K505DRAFT_371708 [Melanomma pulvis-pyrius CBS 109.77]|uniref:Uncharacterized protein n=1 Tax=Melanomma pulvis-pyrius CBS 109.77 TaxID=1314802 RepID=A0A6A6XR19_9PLEO|nr:hypothetical protein K505DRAFT_371708 [Melanomma pulvis-pyrius CBS 109.77]
MRRARCLVAMVRAVPSQRAANSWAVAAAADAFCVLCLAPEVGQPPKKGTTDRCGPACVAVSKLPTCPPVFSPDEAARPLPGATTSAVAVCARASVAPWSSTFCSSSPRRRPEKQHSSPARDSIRKTSVTPQPPAHRAAGHVPAVQRPPSPVSPIGTCLGMTRMAWHAVDRTSLATAVHDARCEAQSWYTIDSFRPSAMALGEQLPSEINRASIGAT